MIKKTVLVLGVTMVAGCASGFNAEHSAGTERTEICSPINEADVVGLFERWNTSLQTGNPKAAVENYAERSILLPTLSGTNRLTKEEKEDYFIHFLESQPVGEVTARHIDIGCNMAIDSGLYTFTMARDGSKVDARYTFAYQWDGQQWSIISHHSSILPSDQ